VGAAVGAIGSIFGAASSAKGAADAAKQQKEAAELQTKVARELHDHWKTYYLSCDVAQIQELCAEPYVVPNYALVLSRTDGEAARNFSRAKSQVVADDNIFCLGDDCQSCNYLSSIEALTISDVANFGYRWEEQYTVQRNQIILENKMTALALGRNLIDQQQAASKLSAELASRVGALAGAAAQNWAKLGSYLLSERGQKQVNDTVNLFKRGFGVTGSEPTETASYKTTTVPETTVESGDAYQSQTGAMNFVDPRYAPVGPTADVKQNDAGEWVYDINKEG
jgi:hypothetical protein